MKAKYVIAPALLLALPLLNAANIISAVDSGMPNSMQLNDPGSTVTGAATIMWTQTLTYSNVSVSVYIFGNEQYKAFLTNAIGPGTTSGNNVASPVTNLAIPFALPAPGTPTELFSGLTLGPGSYYLTIQGLDTTPAGGVLWQSKAGLTPMFGAGVTGGSMYLATSDGLYGSLDASFAPASNLPIAPTNGTVMYSVTGEVVAPEPGTAALMGMGLLAAGLLGRRKR